MFCLKTGIFRKYPSQTWYVLASSVVDRGFEPRSAPTKDYGKEQKLHQKLDEKLNSIIYTF
jgi:hypothetical protein